MDCVNLKREFGNRYRVGYEESYYAEHGTDARKEDPWLVIIPCRNGEIYPWGGRNLAAGTNRTGPVANKLKALPFTTVAQDGDDGANIVFDVMPFEEVTRIMKPRKRRRLSALEKETRVRRLREYWAHKRQVGALAEGDSAAA